MTFKTIYPNIEMKNNILKLGDVVKAFEGPWGTALVEKIDENGVTFFRPYGTATDENFGNYVITYTGAERWTETLNSSKTAFVYSRKEEVLE